VITNELLLINNHLVLSAAAKAGVEIILSGHIHRNTGFKEGAIVIACAGSATVFEEPQGNWIHLFDISVDSGAVTMHKSDYQWDRASGAFR
jgi:predicted phosphodiesterase